MAVPIGGGPSLEFYGRMIVGYLIQEREQILMISQAVVGLKSTLMLPPDSLG